MFHISKCSSYQEQLKDATLVICGEVQIIICTSEALATVGITMVDELLVMAAVEMCIGAPTAGSHNVFYVLSPTVV